MVPLHSFTKLSFFLYFSLALSSILCLYFLLNCFFFWLSVLHYVLLSLFPCFVPFYIYHYFVSNSLYYFLINSFKYFITFSCWLYFSFYFLLFVCHLLIHYCIILSSFSSSFPHFFSSLSIIRLSISRKNDLACFPNYIFPVHFRI